MALEITRISRPPLVTKGQNQLAMQMVVASNPIMPNRVVVFYDKGKDRLKKEPANEPSAIVQMFFV